MPWRTFVYQCVLVYTLPLEVTGGTTRNGTSGHAHDSQPGGPVATQSPTGPLSGRAVRLRVCAGRGGHVCQNF